MARLLNCAFILLMTIGFAFAQGDRGTLAGTVTDQTGAVVAGARVAAENSETHNTLATVTTETGSYTLTQVPVGDWNISVEAPGFKRFASVGNSVQVAATVRVDARLEIGASSESVTVQADAVTLTTESADITTNVAKELIQELPILWANGWNGNQAVRNPLSIAQIMPGVGGGTSFFGFSGQTSGGSSINGAPPGTFKVLVEGQDSTPVLYGASIAFYAQSSVEALEQFSLQSSNYAAEFGQAQGGIFNFTTKSGTNQYHGGAFYRLTNEALNAHQPYSGLRLPSRQNNYGWTFGGPVRIPHVYDGRNKTFFFFSYEGFHSVLPAPSSGTFTTVPTADDRAGNFAYALGGQLTCGGAAATCKDALGNPVFAGQVFDPKTLGADGVTRLQFPGNAIPLNRMDPVALKIQTYLPAPQNTTSLNFQRYQVTERPELIPSIKIDHNFSERLKLSIFDSGLNGTAWNTPDGMPNNITRGRPDWNWANTTRLSVDYTVRPTVLLHLGSGYVYFHAPDLFSSEEDNFDQVAKLGLKGALYNAFPGVSGLSNTSASGASIGGMALPIGPNFFDDLRSGNFTAVTALNWVTGSHSYKFGVNFQNSMNSFPQCGSTWGSYAFSPTQTGQSALQGTTTNGATGLNYASFLLGLPNSASIGPCRGTNWHAHSYGIYAQDTWKVTRRLTLDYGLRYDLQPPKHEQYDRVNSFSPSITNPSAGNLPGGVIYLGSGPGTCNCKDFLKDYKFAFGPRFGLAYQVNADTVIRAGWGIFFGIANAPTGNAQGQSTGTGADPVSFATQANGGSALPNGLQGGLVYSTASFAATKGLPGALPTLNPATGLSTLNAPTFTDSSSGRPPRTQQFNLAVQRNIIKGLNVEAAYVANRGVWLNASMAPINTVTPAILAARGLSLANAADRTLLNSAMSTTLVKNAGYTIPFATYPGGTTLTNRLRPFPQYNNNLDPNAPLGKSWYDSLQMKANFRLPHNISGLSTYTWAKSQVRTGLFNNPACLECQKRLDPNTIPQAFQISMTYQTPHLKSTDFLGSNIAARAVLSDWQVGAVLRYQSGALITAPTSTNTLSTYLAGAPTQYMTRVPGEPLYLTDINTHIDPKAQTYLNPKAWQECGPIATYGCGSPGYADFRQRRSPQEQLSLGRRFVFSDKTSRYFELRIELTNPFNRIVFPDMTVGNPLTAATPTRNSAGEVTGGFGFINVNNIPAGTARNMLVVGRIAF